MILKIPETKKKTHCVRENRDAGLKQLFPFYQVREQHIFKIVVDVGFGQIDLVLSAFYLQIVEVIVNGRYIMLFHFPGIELKCLPAFEVDKLMRAVGKPEIPLEGMVGNMKKNDFVFVVAQMLQGRKQLVGFLAVEHIAENNHQRALVNALGNLMQYLRGVGIFAQMRVFGPDELGQFAIHQFGIYRRNTRVGLKFHPVGKKSKPHRVALFAHQINQRRRHVHRKGQFVVLNFAAFCIREQHRRRGVDNQLAAQVGFLFVLLYKKLVGSRIEFPVDVLGRFALVVEAVLGKFHRKAMKRAAVQTGNKAFYHFAGNQPEVIELMKLLYVENILQNEKNTVTPEAAISAAKLE